ncbi:MAG: RHS repeat-associated core domain-containing protein [Candidatus Kapaibacterium sp.]
MGNRVRKFVSNPNKTTYYVRDASGNVMSTYEKTGSGNIKQIEVPLYGSDRVGMAKRSAERGTFTTTDTSSRWLGYKMYELKDHLGNVRVVLGDKKTRTTGTNSFQPDVVSYSGYFPFGMQMQEDTWQSPLYRYGYNGQEKESQINDNTYSTEYRLIDTRIGRWMTRDKLESKFPAEGPYTGYGNNPIWHSDPMGLETTEGLENYVIKPLLEEVDKQKVNAVAELRNYNGTDNNELARLQQNVEKWTKAASETNNEVNQLRESDVVYDFDGFDNNLYSDHGGITYYKDGRITMKLAGPAVTKGDFKKNFSNKAHELKHMFQYENRQLSYSRTGGLDDGIKVGKLGTIMNELEAYERGHLWGQFTNIKTWEDVKAMPSYQFYGTPQEKWDEQSQKFIPVNYGLYGPDGLNLRLLKDLRDAGDYFHEIK